MTTKSAQPDADGPRGNNFLGLTDAEASYRNARVVVVPVAYDATTSYRAGTKYGPAAIIAASREIESSDRDAEPNLEDIGIATALEVEARVEGPAVMVDAVEQEITRHLIAGKFCAFGLSSFSIKPINKQ